MVIRSVSFYLELRKVIATLDVGGSVGSVGEHYLNPIFDSHSSITLLNRISPIIYANGSSPV